MKFGTCPRELPKNHVGFAYVSDATWYSILRITYNGYGNMFIVSFGIFLQVWGLGVCNFVLQKNLQACQTGPGNKTTSQHHYCLWKMAKMTFNKMIGATSDQRAFLVFFIFAMLLPLIGKTLMSSSCARFLCGNRKLASLGKWQAQNYFLNGLGN